MESESSKVDQFAHLLAPIQNQLLGYVYAIVQNLDDARDILQQSNLAAWRKFDEFDSDRSFSAWIYGFVRLEIVAFHRDRARSRVMLSDDLVQKLVEVESRATAEKNHDTERARLDALAHCKRKLSSDDLELIESFYLHGCKARDLADKRQRSPQSVSNSLTRIRKALYACIRAQLARGGAS